MLRLAEQIRAPENGDIRLRLIYASKENKKK
jgi:hypothetical protein